MTIHWRVGNSGVSRCLLASPPLLLSDVHWRCQHLSLATFCFLFARLILEQACRWWHTRAVRWCLLPSISLLILVWFVLSSDAEAADPSQDKSSVVTLPWNTSLSIFWKSVDINFPVKTQREPPSSLKTSPIICSSYSFHVTSLQTVSSRPPILTSRMSLHRSTLMKYVTSFFTSWHCVCLICLVSRTAADILTLSSFSRSSCLLALSCTLNVHRNVWENDGHTSEEHYCESKHSYLA